MKLINAILICLISGQLFGTAQVPDFLIYENDTLSIYSNPLEVYFEQIGSRELPKFEGCSSTACWRGYVGIWELRNDSIFLKEVTTCHKYKCDTIVNADLNELFGDRYMNNEVFADWISYEIINPHGKQIKYIHQGYESIYEYERGFEFINGKLVKVNNYDNTKSRESVYSKEPELLHKFFYDNIDWKLVESVKLSDKKRVFATIKIGENEKPIEIEIVRGINPEIDKEAERIIKLIPEWEVYYKRGKVVKTQWNLPIYFEKEFYEKKIKKENGG